MFFETLLAKEGTSIELELVTVFGAVFHYMVRSYRYVKVTAPMQRVQISSRSIECHWTM